MVNVAYDAPVDFAPREQIEDAERRLYELAETGRYDGGFQRFATALTTAVDMAANAYQRDGKLSGLATGLADLDRMMGGLQSSDLVILAGRPGMGKTALATNIAYNIAQGLARRGAARRAHRNRQRRHRRLLLARNVGRAARHPHHRRADRDPVVPHPPRRDRSERTSTASRRWRARWRRSRSTSTRPAASRSRSSPRARAGSSASAGSTCWSSTTSSCCHGSSTPRPGRPRAGSHRDHHRPQGAGEGA